MIQSDVKLVEIGERVLLNNDIAAARVEHSLRLAGVVALNLIAGPGAGKTSLIRRTIEALRGKARVGVIEGDIAGSIDTSRVLAAGAADAVQINTGGNCHLEANMVAEAINGLNLDRLDILLIENVGNLVCPTHWRLGEQLRICLMGASEGDDKPIKYPEIFAHCQAVVLNKTDLIDLVDFDRDRFVRGVRALNPEVPIFDVSCRSGVGIESWANWIMRQRSNHTPGEVTPCASP